MMRPDVDNMRQAVDKMWLYLLLGWAAFAVSFATYGLVLVNMRADPSNLLWGFLALIFMVPWALQCVKVQRKINMVNRRNVQLERAR